MHHSGPRLHIIFGKIASGKSTLAKRLAAEPATVLISEDVWLKTLFGEALQTLEDYIRCSRLLRATMAPHVDALLQSGVSVVLDFAANTPAQRQWFREIVEVSGVGHALHVLDVSDDLCLARLQRRNAEGSHPFTVTESQFHDFMQHVTRPGADEGFNLVIHGAD